MSWITDSREPRGYTDRLYDRQYEREHGMHDRAKRILAEAVAKRGLGELKKVCAWCGKHMGGPVDGVVSHGICPECSARTMEEWLGGKE